MTMQVIQRVELASSASSITFSSIPQTYTDLLVVVSGRDTLSGTATQLNLQFNGVGGTAYADVTLEGNGSGVSAGARTSQSVIRATGVAASSATANTFGSISIYIPNYRSSVAKNASIDAATENNATQAFINLVSGIWSGTAAITSISMALQSGGSFVANSSATLYGILAGSDGIVSVS